MNTRKTSDYSPTMKGSAAENAAINARREMLGWFAGRQAKPEPTRKTWRERMQQRATGFDTKANLSRRDGYADRGLILA